MLRPIAIAACLLLPAALPAPAADLGPGPDEYTLPQRSGQTRQAIVVVPGCHERNPVVLGCTSREDLFYPDDTELAVIERSLSRSGRRPYPELFSWQR